MSYDLLCVNEETGEEYHLSESNKDYALFAVCNASYYGGGFCPAPDSKLDDGLVDIALINGLSLAKALPMIGKYNEGTATQETFPDLITNARVKSGRFWMEDGSMLLGNSDGENFDYTSLDFKVEPRALRLCFIKE
jgi:diacylglycerol kinase family enzyme